MPRAKRTVGFWRGDLAVTKKASLQPPPDRYTGTRVDGWPNSWRERLRRELLAVRRDDSKVSHERLAEVANNWVKSYAHDKPPSIPKKVTVAHIMDLLHTSPSPSQRQHPGERRR